MEKRSQKGNTAPQGRGEKAVTAPSKTSDAINALFRTAYAYTETPEEEADAATARQKLDEYLGDQVIDQLIRAELDECAKSFDTVDVAEACNHILTSPSEKLPEDLLYTLMKWLIEHHNVKLTRRTYNQIFGLSRFFAVIDRLQALGVNRAEAERRVRERFQIAQDEDTFKREYSRGRNPEMKAKIDIAKAFDQNDEAGFSEAIGKARQGTKSA